MCRLVSASFENASGTPAFGSVCVFGQDSKIPLAASDWKRRRSDADS